MGLNRCQPLSPILFIHVRLFLFLRQNPSQGLFRMADSTWTVRVTNIRRLTWATHCRYCGIQLLSGENPGFCCGKKGKYLNTIPALRPLPPEFSVFINDPQISALSRQLNLIFSFASLETSMKFPSTHGGMFAIQGRVYHRIRPTHESSPIRWILYDGMHPESVPHQYFADSIRASWLDAVRNALALHNPIARGLLSMHEEIQSHAEHAAHRLSLILRDPGTSTEVAAIMHFANTAFSEVVPRSAVVINKDGSSQTIPTVSSLWEPLAYPLLFPCGELGWGLSPTSDHDVDPDATADIASTQIWHYRARLLREDRFHIFGRLTNEYAVDMFTRELDCRLHYVRTNIDRIRREEAELMGDGAQSHGENVYLPASFLGSVRWAHERTADALAVASAFGPPTMFITFTCNPYWVEIQERLRPGQQWFDIPVVVARVFKRKLTQFIECLKTSFPKAGDLIYVIHRVEFQKRGAPHAHILVRYSHELLSPHDIDSVISAELPDDPDDAALVKEFMTHHHPSSGALPPYCDPHKKGSCRHHYPHKINNDTTIAHDGRIHYRRRRARDSMIVPHCLPFLRKFLAHINFEIAGASHLFQYLFKYVHKGNFATCIPCSHAHAWFSS
jgi:hypothetical protein